MALFIKKISINKKEGIILAVVVLVCAIAGFGGVYLYSRTVLPGRTPEYRQQPSGGQTESTPPVSETQEEETTQEEPTGIVVRVNAVETMETEESTTASEPFDSETMALFRELLAITGGDESQMETEDPGVYLEIMRRESSNALSRISVDAAISHETGQEGKKRVVVTIANNSDSLFQGYIYLEFFDSAGNRTGLDILKVSELRPQSTEEFESWASGDSSETIHKVIGKFSGE